MGAFMWQKRARLVTASIALAGCTESGVVLEPGDETKPPDDPKPVRVDLLAAGPYHTCAIRSGSLFCWGSNADGELGVGDQVDRPVATPVSGNDWTEVVVGETHTCARRTAGSVWCWGDGKLGQLGVDQVGPLLEPTFVSLPAPVRQLASKYAHTCAIDDTGALYCWGYNTEGQLGQDDPFPADGVNRSTPVRVGTDADWLLVDTGQGHTCGIRSPGDLWCWGRNSDGELGFGSVTPGQLRVPTRSDDLHDATYVRIGQSTSVALRGSGILYGWGDNTGGSSGFADTAVHIVPGRVSEFTDWKSVSIDTFHGCGVRSGNLYCWGRNAEGQLGVGDTDDRLGPTMVDDAADWVAVSAGRFHTCALKGDGSVRCAGQNHEGQLGTGDFDQRNVFTEIVLPP